MLRASVLLPWACAIACAAGPKLAGTSALGWSLGGEAHVFVTGERFAAALYRSLTGHDPARLQDSLAVRPLLAVTVPAGRHGAAVLFPSGAAPGTLTLARFHAAGACGRLEAVTELVFAFPPGSPRATPPAHARVVAVLAARPRGDSAWRAPAASPAVARAAARDLITRVAQAAERARGGLADSSVPAPLGAIALDADRAADAGEVIALPGRDGARPRYAVGFRVRFQAANGDTVLVTGIAVTDSALHALRWVVRPERARLVAGTMRTGRGGRGPVRYSLRGTVAGLRAPARLLLVDEIADIALRDSRATVVDVASRRVVAAHPLALRCP